MLMLVLMLRSRDKFVISSMKLWCDPLTLNGVQASTIECDSLLLIMLGVGMGMESKSYIFHLKQRYSSNMIFFSGGIDPITFIEANSTVCDAVMLLQDDNVEGPETLSLNLLSPTPAIPGFTPTTAIANITIQDINRKFQEYGFEGTSSNLSDVIFIICSILSHSTHNNHITLV